MKEETREGGGELKAKFIAGVGYIGYISQSSVLPYTVNTDHGSHTQFSNFVYNGIDSNGWT